MRVLDTSAVLRSSLDFDGGGFLVTPRVLDEIQSETPQAAVEAALRQGSVKILSPSKDSIGFVADASEATGDSDWLSEADVEALALAFEKKCVILTDDYGIQNVAKKLGVEFESVTQEGITEQIKWVKRCGGCGKIFSPGAETTCGVCGAGLRKKRFKGG